MDIIYLNDMATSFKSTLSAPCLGLDEQAVVEAPTEHIYNIFYNNIITSSFIPRLGLDEQAVAEALTQGIIILTIYTKSLQITLSIPRLGLDE